METTFAVIVIMALFMAVFAVFVLMYTHACKIIASMTDDEYQDYLNNQLDFHHYNSQDWV